MSQNIEHTAEETLDIVREKLNDETNQLIAKATAKASTVAALPIPLFDVAAVTYIQVKLIEDLAELNGASVDNKTRTIMSSAISAIVSKVLSDIAESVAKSANLGSILSGSLIKAAVSGFMTTITGEVYRDHFENGGTVDNIELSSYLNYFQAQLQSDRVSVSNISAQLIDGAMGKFGIA